MSKQPESSLAPELSSTRAAQRTSNRSGLPKLADARTLITDQTLERAVNAAVTAEGEATPGAQKVMLRALTVQRSLVLAHLRRMRKKYPHDSPAQLTYRIGQHYLRAVSGAGAVAGAAALIPGAGTLVGLGVSAGAAVGFLELSALYAQSIAEIHGMPSDADRHGQALVMAVMLGDEGRMLVRNASDLMRGRGNLAATVLMVNTGSGVFDALFDKLRSSFLKRVTTSQVAGTFGRILPFGVGALIGGVGNRRMGRNVITTTESLFGEIPAHFPEWLALPDEPLQVFVVNEQGMLDTPSDGAASTTGTTP